MSVDITFLIPCYNCSKTIKNTIKSIIDLEYQYGKKSIICCNDGSKDNTKQVLEQLKQEFKIIKIINQENKGLAGVRNTLLKNVSTHYFMFIDSDDLFCDKDFLNQNIEHCLKHNDDIVINNFKRSKGLFKRAFSYKISKNTNKISFIKRCISLFIWNNLFKTSFIKKYNYVFKEGINTFEDWSFMTFYMFLTNKIYFNKKTTLIYTIQNNSYSNMNQWWTEKKILDIVENIGLCLKSLSKYINKTANINSNDYKNNIFLSCSLCLAISAFYGIIFFFNKKQPYNKSFYFNWLHKFWTYIDSYFDIMKLKGFSKGRLMINITKIARIGKIYKTISLSKGNKL